MHETELSDLSDDVDYAASIQQGSASIYRTDSGKRSQTSEPEGAEAVYIKDNVTIHPTQFASERISGRLKLLKQGNALFMTWVPYKGHGSSARISDKDKNLYSIRSLAFSDIRSIRKHTPTLGWQYVIVVMSSGLAFPPFYFYNGGVKEFFTTVRQHVFLVRSAEDANIFLVNDFQNPLQKTLSSLELHGFTNRAPPADAADATDESHSTDDQEESNINTRPHHSELRSIGKPRQKHHDPARDLSIQVLEKFSLVTRLARETTSQLFGESYIDGFTSNGKKHDQVTSTNYQPTTSDDTSHVLNEVSAIPNPGELEKLSLVWGKPRQPPLCHEEWNTFLDSE
ncbi:hypothetical protein M569_16338, partial [Genlisea aurea]